jgi:dTDP-4-dehydrorhamnose reductase
MNKLNKKERVLITGGSGLLGSNLSTIFKEDFKVYFTFNKNSINLRDCEGVKLDLTNFEETKKLILKIKPKVIIHCAALTNVDYCEENPKEAELINSEATKNIGEISNEIKSKLIYLSTDSVFDGVKGDYSEEDKTNPLNVYGRTKLEGEEYVKDSCRDYLIVRTNIYGWNAISKYSLAEWMLDKLEKNEEFYGFKDISFTPISVNNLGRAILEACKKDIRGLYHIAGSEKCSKFEFANTIADVFNLNKNLIKSVNSDILDFKAKRAKNMSLNTEKIQRSLETKLLGVKEGLEEFKSLRKS